MTAIQGPNLFVHDKRDSLIRFADLDILRDVLVRAAVDTALIEPKSLIALRLFFKTDRSFTLTPRATGIDPSSLRGRRSF
jgi:hypothetical protein